MDEGEGWVREGKSGKESGKGGQYRVAVAHLVVTVEIRMKSSTKVQRIQESREKLL